MWEPRASLKNISHKQIDSLVACTTDLDGFVHELKITMIGLNMTQKSTKLRIKA